MAIIKPFRGVRPPRNLVEQIESRPYDVLDSEEAREEAGTMKKVCIILLSPKSILLRAQVNMMQEYMRVLLKISTSFKRMDGCYKMIMTIITFMHRQ